MKRRLLAAGIAATILSGVIAPASARADDGIRHTGPVLVTIGGGFLPTTLCGRLGPAEDCFAGFVGDLNIAILRTPHASLMFDLSGVFYRDPVEVGALGGLGLRLRLDRIGLIVPYGVAVLYAGGGAYQGGGGAARLSSRLGVGAEVSLRRGGPGAGLFLELGAGAGCCTAVIERGELAYSQFFLLTGVSFP
jgi:hypothetical protein